MQFPKNSSWAGRTTSSLRKWQCWNLSHYLFGRTQKMKLSLLELATGSCCNSLVFSVRCVHSPVCNQLEGGRWHPPSCGLEWQAPWRNTKKISSFNFQLQKNRNIFVQPGAFSQYFLGAPSHTYCHEKRKKFELFRISSSMAVSFSLPAICRLEIFDFYLHSCDAFTQCDSPYHTVPSSLSTPLLPIKGEYCLPYGIHWWGRAPSCSQIRRNSFFLYNCVLHIFFMQWDQTFQA